MYDSYIIIIIIIPILFLLYYYYYNFYHFSICLYSSIIVISIISLVIHCSLPSERGLRKPDEQGLHINSTSSLRQLSQLSTSSFDTLIRRACVRDSSIVVMWDQNGKTAYE